MRAARCALPDLAGVRATAVNRLSSAAVAAAMDHPEAAEAPTLAAAAGAHCAIAACRAIVARRAIAVCRAVLARHASETRRAASCSDRATRREAS